MIKTIEMFSFLHLVNSSVIIGLSFLLLMVSVIISSKAINTLFCFLCLDFIFQYFYKRLAYHLNGQWKLQDYINFFFQHLYDC